jgi:hypothetical protein
MRARLTQSLRTSLVHDIDTSFDNIVWVGTPGGAALGTDPNPNTTPPAANRILKLTPRPGALGGFQGVIHCCPVPIAAASITFQGWFFDDTQALWIPSAIPITLTPTPGAAGLGNLQQFNVGAQMGVRFFIQIQANTNVQAMYYASV